MGEARPEVVERILTRLIESEELLGRFLDAPLAVATELTGEAVDAETLEAIGSRLREHFGVADGSTLSDADLERVAGGSFAYRLQSWRPIIGSSSGYTSTISYAG